MAYLQDAEVRYHLPVKCAALLFLKEYAEILEEVESVNMLGDMLVELVQTGSAELANASIVSISLSPATPSVPSQPPIIPPLFENITDNDDIVLVVPIDTPPDDDNGDDVIVFTIPRKLVIIKAPPNEVRLLLVNVVLHCPVDWSFGSRDIECPG